MVLAEHIMVILVQVNILIDLILLYLHTIIIIKLIVLGVALVYQVKFIQEVMLAQLIAHAQNT